MASQPNGSPQRRSRVAMWAVAVLCCSSAIFLWYWNGRRPRSLDQLDPNDIPAEYRFDGQPRELVAVLSTTSAGIGCGGVAFSPDGKYIAGGFGIGGVVLWEAGNLKEVAVLKGHCLPVVALVFTSDAKTLISGSYDGTIRFWDVATWKPKEQETLRRPTDQVCSLALAPDDKTLASGNADRGRGDDTVRLWNLNLSPPQEVDVIKLSGHSVSISPDGRTLACTHGGTIQLWDFGDSKINKRAIIRVSTDSVWRVVFAPDSKTLACCGRDETVRLGEFDGEKLRHRAELHGHASIHLYGLVFSPDGKRLVSADMDGRVIVWDVEKRSELYRWQLPYGPRGVAFAPDGRHLAISTNKSIVCILRLPR